MSYFIIALCIASAHNFLQSSQVKVQLKTQALVFEKILRERASNGSLTRECFKDLIDGGANIDAQDDKGMTALMEAVRHHHEDIVQFLLDSGANVDIQDNTIDGDTALTWAVWSGCDQDIVQLLICAHANVNGRNRCGNTPISYAVGKQHGMAMEKRVKIIQLLLHAGADASNQDIYGLTPFMYKPVDTNMFVMLINAGGNPYMKSYDEQMMTERLHAVNQQVTDGNKLSADKMKHHINIRVDKANKTVFDLKPEFISDVKIQDALMAYARRGRQQQALLIAKTPLPQILIDLISEYAGVPPVTAPTTPPSTENARLKNEVDASIPKLAQLN